MNPVLQRELRAEARRPVTYWLRTGVAGLFFVLLDLSLRSLGGIDATCRALFPLLHCLLLGVSALVAPLLIVEAIAREKREGTLELLLLTPLTLNAVLRAKTIVFTARTLVLVIGALPVIAFTVLFGGVGREELLFLVLLQATAVVLALAIGLLAAMWGRTWIRSLALAGVLSVAISGGMALLLFVTFQHLIGDTFARELWPHPEGIAGWVSGAARLVGNAGGVWSETLGTIPRTLTDGWLWLFGATFLVAVLGAVLLRAAARAALRLSRDPERLWITGRAQGPAGRRFEVSRRHRRRWLRGNPVRWLMRYPWEVRLFRWAGAALVAGLQVMTGLWAPRFNGWFVAQLTIVLSLGLLFVLAAAASFRREREEGSLEMLLVTPLTAGQLLRGRVLGMWWQFAPAFLAWGAGLMAFLPATEPRGRAVALGVWVVALFLTVPAIGLEAAFQFRTYWRAAGAALFGSIGVSGLMFWVGLNEDALGFLGGVGVAVLLVVAGLCGPGFKLRLELRRNGENFRSHGRLRRRSRRHGREASRQARQPSQIPA